MNKESKIMAFDLNYAINPDSTFFRINLISQHSQHHNTLYTLETGEIFNSRFVQSLSFRYNVEGQWMAVPFSLDLNILYYNRTIFDQLGLKRPPPHGQWAPGEWSWKKLAEYSDIIARSGIAAGFDPRGTFSFLESAARNYGGMIVNNDRKCGYKIPGMLQFHNEVLVPLFGPNASVPRVWQITNTPQFQQFINSTIASDPMKLPFLTTTRSSIRPFSMVYEGPGGADYRASKFHPTDFPNGHIGQVLMPGRSSWLAGTGVAITAKSRKKALGWKFILEVTSEEYQRRAHGLIDSPYIDVVENNPDWNLPEYEAFRLQYRRAAPSFYPFNAFKEGGELSAREPWRTYIHEMVFKNYSTETLLDRFCQQVDFIMLPTCSREHMSIVDKGCNPSTLSRNLTYVWDPEKPCRDAGALPEDIGFVMLLLPILRYLSVSCRLLAL